MKRPPASLLFLIILAILLPFACGCTIPFLPQQQGKDSGLITMAPTVTQPVAGTTAAGTGPTQGQAPDSGNAPLTTAEPAIPVTEGGQVPATPQATGSQGGISPSETGNNGQSPEATGSMTEGPVTSYILSEDINRHFINIAFGNKRTAIDRAQSSMLAVSVRDGYLNADIAALKEFIQEFNKLSRTTTLSENIKTETPGKLNIRFLKQDGLKEIDMKNIQDTIRDPQNNDIQILISTKASNGDMTAYVNADLQGERKIHYMLRALMYMLGFAGYTADYPDSLFNTYSDTTTKLSIIDKEAVKLMYGGNSISNGMNVDTVKRVLMMK
jgi:hypothetical protein